MTITIGNEELRIALLRCEHQRDQLEAAQLDLYEMSLAIVDECSASAFLARAKVVASRVEELKSQVAALSRFQEQTLFWSR